MRPPNQSWFLSPRIDLHERPFGVGGAELLRVGHPDRDANDLPKAARSAKRDRGALVLLSLPFVAKRLIAQSVTVSVLHWS